MQQCDRGDWCCQIGCFFRYTLKGTYYAKLTFCILSYFHLGLNDFYSRICAYPSCCNVFIEMQQIWSTSPYSSRDKKLSWLPCWCKVKGKEIEIQACSAISHHGECQLSAQQQVIISTMAPSPTQLCFSTIAAPPLHQQHLSISTMAPPSPPPHPPTHWNISTIAATPIHTPVPLPLFVTETGVRLKLRSSGKAAGPDDVRPRLKDPLHSSFVAILKLLSGL